MKTSLWPFYRQWVGMKVVNRKKSKFESQILVFLKGKGKNGICKGERSQKWLFTEDKRKIPKDQGKRYI